MAPARPVAAPALTFAITTTGVTTGTATITAVDVQSFPDLSAYVVVQGNAGQPVAGLPPEAFTLFENSAAIPAGRLAATEKEVGGQIVFAIDTSAPFKARDINAVNRLDYIRQALLAFGGQGTMPGDVATPRLADGVDDVTLLAPEGILVTHASQASDFVQALTAYTTTFSGAANPLPLMNQALDFASETTPRPGMPRYVVLFSNGIGVTGQAAPLTDLVTRARGARVAIHAVYVGPGGASDSPGGQSLRQLAESTGGRFLILEKPESLMPLLGYLASQRQQYQLRYRSAIATTGQQSLVVQVTLPEGSQITSDAATFPLRIEPPALALSAVPAVIQLSPPASGGAVVSYDVPVAIDFPDGHPRRLRSLELLADGQVVDQQLAPDPGAQPLRWNLSGYQSDGPHTLLAQAVDELGLLAQSPSLTVTLSFSALPTLAAAPAAGSAAATAMAVAAVPPPAFTPFMWIGLGLLALAVVVGGSGVWWVRRSARQKAASREGQPARRPAWPPVRAKTSNGDKTIPPPARPTPPAKTAPLPPPPPARPAARPPAFSFHAPALFARKRTTPAAKPQGRAYLEVVEGAGAGAPREPIEILSPTLRLGRDPARAEAVFQDRSMSRLHARIVEAPEGVFRIFDEGSTSGTWVNFTQIPAEEGWELKPGDLINLGRIQLRFKRRAPVSAPAGPGAGQASRPGAERPSAVDGATEPYRPLKK